MRTLGWSASTLCGLAMAMSLSLPPRSALAQEPIKIGFSSELSGAFSFNGTACVQAMQFGERKINSAGGVLGRELQFIVSDNQTTPSQAAAAARKFDVQDNVLAISGPTGSDDALAIYGYAEQNKIPFIVPVAAFPQLTKPGTRYTFRIESDSVGWGYAEALFLASLKPGAKVALMMGDFAHFRGIAAGFKYQAPKSGLQVVAEYLFPQTANDATVQAAQVVAARPDYVILISAGAFRNTLANTLMDFGMRPDQIVHIEGSTVGVLGLGPRSVGSYYGTFFDSNLDKITPEGQEFIREFNQEIGRAPSYTENFCYLVPYLVKEAVEKAGVVDREKFRDALSALKSVDPVSGIPIEFDQNGARKEFMYFMQIQSVAEKTYKSKQVFYTEWSPEVLPVYEIMK